MRPTVGNIVDISRPARSDTSVNSALAPAKRAVSSGSRTKARTTRMPLICSRSTALTRSMRACISLTAGTMRLITNPRMSTADGMATSSTTDRPTSSCTARTNPIAIVSGAEIIIVAAITISIWTCCTSLVMRVMRDGAPIAPTSRAENAVTWWKRSRRTSRPNPIATRAPCHTAIEANVIWTRAKHSITAPVRQM